MIAFIQKFNPLLRKMPSTFPILFFPPIFLEGGAVGDFLNPGAIAKKRDCFFAFSLLKKPYLSIKMVLFYIKIIVITSPPHSSPTISKALEQTTTKTGFPR